VHEPWLVTGRQHLGTGKTPDQPAGDISLHARDRRRVPHLAAIPKHGQCLGQAQRARAHAVHPGDHLPRDSLQPSG